MFPPFFAGSTAPRLAFAVGGAACCVCVCDGGGGVGVEGVVDVDESEAERGGRCGECVLCLLDGWGRGEEEGEDAKVPVGVGVS